MPSTALPLARCWLPLEARRRWRSLAVLALLVALSAGTVLAAVAGARRGDSALDRLLARTRPATAQVVPNQQGFRWDRVRRLPEVAAVTTYPAYASLDIEGLPDIAAQLTPFIPADDAAMRTIERPVVLAGRRPDPGRTDEVAVTARFPRSTGRGVGDRLTLDLYTPRQADADLTTADVGAPRGPRVRLRIVGVIRSPWYADPVGGSGSVIPSPGLLRRYRPNILGRADSVPLSGLVRLRRGAVDLPRFRRDLAAVTGRPDIDVLDRSDTVRHARAVVGFESVCLLAFGATALAASVVLVGLVVVRQVTVALAELRALLAVGLTRRQGVVLATVAPALAGLVGVAAGVGAAVGASRWLPFGVAATLEPDPGPAVDGLVLGGGGAMLVVLVAAAAAVTAWLGLGRRRATVPRRSAVARTAARIGLPVPVAVGTRFALEPRRGTDPVAVRPALLGALTGVLGVVAVLTFSAGVDDASTHPQRFGQTYQLEAVLGIDGNDYVRAEPALRRLAADPDVRAVTDLRVGAGTSGDTTVVTHSYAAVGTAAPLTLLRGTAPADEDEVVLAPTTAAQLGAAVGDRIPLRGDRGGRTVRVSGIGFTVQSSTSGYDRGGWVTGAGYRRLFSTFKEHGALVALRSGADTDRVAARLHHAAAPDNLLVFTPFVPPQFTEIRNVGILPAMLGGFLALLAVGAVAHALISAVRRRRGDIAVLRALGLTRAQCRRLVLTQATVIAGVGLIFGVPLGLVLGRLLWRAAADYTPLRYQPPTAVWTLLLIVPAAVLLAVLLAGWPARQAARLRIGEVLRAE